MIVAENSFCPWELLNTDQINAFSDGTPGRSYLYTADFTIWLWTILLRGESGRAYNVGSEESVSIAETAQVVARSVSPNIQIGILGIPNPALPVEQYVPSTKRAQNELGLTRSFFLNEGIKRTGDYLQGNNK